MDYRQIRFALSELSGIPAMAITTQEHIELIEGKLRRAGGIKCEIDRTMLCDHIPPKWRSQIIQLFGEHHKAVLSELAGVDKRTVQRWCAGSLDVPQWVIENINETYELWKESL